MDQGSSMLLGIEGLRVLDVRLDAGKQPGESQVRPIKLGTSRSSGAKQTCHNQT